MDVAAAVSADEAQTVLQASEALGEPSAYAPLRIADTVAAQEEPLASAPQSQTAAITGRIDSTSSEVMQTRSYAHATARPGRL